MPDLVRQGKGDVIYRQDAIRVLGAQCKKEYNKTCGEYCECMEYMALRDMPSAQKKGHWIDTNPNEPLDPRQTCSECGNTEILHSANFCPHCGADMRQKGNANG